jgi:hypothetical protein
MPLDSRPAVVAEMSTSAIPPGAGVAPPYPATPTTPAEATDRGGNHSYFSSRSIFHRGFEMIECAERDGEGWATPAYLAWRPSVDPLNIRGKILHLSHPRFGFEPTQDWFASEIDRILAERDKHCTTTIADGLGVLLCFALFGLFSCGVAALA